MATDGIDTDTKSHLMADRLQNGKFGDFGGMFIPESLIPACSDLEKAFYEAFADEAFIAALNHLLKTYAGRPTPLTYCENLSEKLGIRLFLKREDLTHTGSHKINNVLGQALLAKRMGKKRMIAETGAGQHGVAAATAAALFGLDCVVFMGEVDVSRQALNVFRMKLLGAEVVPVKSGSATLKDAVNEALRDWVASVETTHYCIGSAMGPHPYPLIVRQLQSVIGKEAKAQFRDLSGDDPDFVVACVGGGSNAIGTFAGFVDTKSRLVGVEAAGGAAMHNGIPGVVHGMRSKFLQDESGQILEAESISAGLDYPGIGPEHAYLGTIGRANYSYVNDEEVIAAFRVLSETEGIIPALEPAHALAYILRAVETGEIPADASVMMTLSGRGDKDVAQIMEILEL